jgi:transcriptional regulator with PAS, ATPase and Fis domain
MNTPNQKTKPPEERPPTRENLEIYLQNNMADIVQSAITKWKLPYTIGQGDGKYVLKDIFCRGEQHLERFVTEDIETKEMKSDCVKIMMTSYECLITGETGTGKEIIAKSMIGKMTGEVKAINCGALPENLIESELFGHVRGAFTDAREDKEGLCAAARNGVMFLDEIGDLPLTAQGKLLRAIQEKRIRKVGSVRDEEISCRFVCATHKDIRKMVDDGTFRRDLYARISSLEVHIKPLRERLCDIIPITMTIAGHEPFLKEYRPVLERGEIDLSLNVRSLQQYVIRYQVLGRIKKD